MVLKIAVIWQFVVLRYTHRNGTYISDSIMATDFERRNIQQEIHLNTERQTKTSITV